MSKILLVCVGFLCIVISSSSASVSISRKKNAEVGQPRGVVSPIGRCGGVATPLQLRISECEGVCRLQPGRVYDCEKDFIPGG